MRRECRERFSRHRLQRKPLVSYPGMHHGTCVSHVPWCMLGSLTRGGGENVPGISGACATRNFTYLVRGAWVNCVELGLGYDGICLPLIMLFLYHDTFSICGTDKSNVNSYHTKPSKMLKSNNIHIIVTQALNRLKSPDTLFVQPLVLANIKGNTKPLYYWPFAWGIHRWPVESSSQRPSNAGITYITSHIKDAPILYGFIMCG